MEAHAVVDPNPHVILRKFCHPLFRYFRTAVLISDVLIANIRTHISFDLLFYDPHLIQAQRAAREIQKLLYRVWFVGPF